MVIEEDIFNRTGEEASKIVETWRRVNANKLNPSGEDLGYLLKTYNKYIDKYPNNLRCGDCRRIVLNSWKNVITVWETIELL